MGLNVTTAAAGGASAEKTLFERLAIWCHHNEAYVWTAYFGTMVITGLTPSQASMYWVLFAIQHVFWAGIPMSWVGDRLHMRKFWDCDFCKERMPLNAPEQGERYSQALINRHNGRRTLVLFLAAISVPIFMTFVLKPLLGPFTAFGIVPLWALMMYFGWLDRKHDQLQPWCPICRRRGDDGDDHPVVVPEPTPPSAKVDA